MDHAIRSGIDAARALLAREPAGEVRPRHPRLVARGDLLQPHRRLADQLLAAARTLYVAASLRQAGHEVRFLDGAFRSREESSRSSRPSRRARRPLFHRLRLAQGARGRGGRPPPPARRLHRRRRPLPDATPARSACARRPARRRRHRRGEDAMVELAARLERGDGPRRARGDRLPPRRRDRREPAAAADPRPRPPALPGARPARRPRGLRPARRPPTAARRSP